MGRKGTREPLLGSDDEAYLREASGDLSSSSSGCGAPVLAVLGGLPNLAAAVTYTTFAVLHWSPKDNKCDRDDDYSMYLAVYAAAFYMNALSAFYIQFRLRYRKRGSGAFTRALKLLFKDPVGLSFLCAVVFQVVWTLYISGKIIEDTQCKKADITFFTVVTSTKIVTWVGLSMFAAAFVLNLCCECGKTGAGGGGGRGGRSNVSASARATAKERRAAASAAAARKRAEEAAAAGDFDDDGDDDDYVSSHRKKKGKGKGGRRAKKKGGGDNDDDWDAYQKKQQFGYVPSSGPSTAAAASSRSKVNRDPDWMGSESSPPSATASAKSTATPSAAREPGSSAASVAQANDPDDDWEAVVREETKHHGPVAAKSKPQSSPTIAGGGVQSLWWWRWPADSSV